jgi:uncharacterized protein (DUF885 family)
MLPKIDTPIKLERIACGWAAHGEGWAIHAETREKAILDYQERVKFYKELEKRPISQKSESGGNV